MTEREKYIDNLEAKIRKAARARRFSEGEEGSILTEYLTQQINSLVKNIGGKTYINDHSGYVFDTGQLFMAQKILTMLSVESSVNTDELHKNLEAARTDG